MSDFDPESETVTETLLDEINILRAENRRLQRRSEIYAAGITAIAVPIDDSDSVQIAKSTLDRVRQLDGEDV